MLLHAKTLKWIVHFFYYFIIHYVCGALVWQSPCYFSAQVKSWSYTCDEYDRCVRQGPLDTTKNDPASPDFQLSLGRCKLVCGDHAVLWPRPREARLGKTVRAFELDDVVLANKGEPKGPRGAVAVELENRIDEQVVKHSMLGFMP